MLLTLLSVMQAKGTSPRVYTSSTQERGSCDDNVSAGLLAFVVLVLVNNGQVGAKEVGRLSQVSKELRQVNLDDHIWAALCQRHWIGTRHIPKRCLELKGHRYLYRQWCSPLLKQRPPNRLARLYRQCSDLYPKKSLSLGPPSCTADEIQLHVLIKYKGVIIVSEVIEGEGMERFCARTVGLKLARPFNLGKAFWECTAEEMRLYQEGQNEYGLNAGCPDFDPANLQVKIHYYRTTDSTMACVLDSKTSPQEYFPLRLHPSPDQTVDLSREQQGGLLGLGPYRSETIQGLALRKTRQAAEINRRFPDAIDLSCYVLFKMGKRGDFGMTEIYFDVMKKPKKADLPAEKFKTRDEESEHGVSLLHILSELQGV
jgi:hypothetical protein